MDRIDPSKSITSWRSAWRSALRCAGLRLRFHDLRRTAITNLSESPKLSEQTIMSIAGHLSRRMLVHYSHIRLQAKRRALDAIARPISEPDATFDQGRIMPQDNMNDAAQERNGARTVTTKVRFIVTIEAAESL